MEAAEVMEAVEVVEAVEAVKVNLFIIKVNNLPMQSFAMKRKKWRYH